MDYITFYNKGIEEKQKGNYEKSASYHLKALEINSDWDFPEAWHNAGAALIRIKQFQESKPYLEKALEYYQENIDYEERPAYNLYWKACVYSLLEDKEKMLQTLKECICLDSAYAEEALYEEDFNNYKVDPDYKKLIEPQIEILKKMRYRGEALSLMELTNEQAKAIEYFRLTCAANDMAEDKMAEMLNSNVQRSPQSMYEYCENPNYSIRLSLHIDTGLLFLELVHQSYNYDLKAFRLYVHSENLELALSNIVQIIGQYIHSLNEENWIDMIKALIPLCRELLYEMPDGAKVKLTTD